MPLCTPPIRLSMVSSREPLTSLRASMPSAVALRAVSFLSWP